jgi:hypothetical protein
MKDKNERIVLGLLTISLWLFMLVFGGVVCETVIVYPNVFHHVPDSLAIARKFAVVAGPGTYFPPLGMVTMITGLVSLFFTWSNQPVRKYLIISLGLFFLGEFIFSMLFFWPKNDIMFGKDAELQSAGYLQKIAAQFRAGHWIRVLISGISAAIMFGGYVKFIVNRTKHQSIVRNI